MQGGNNELVKKAAQVINPKIKKYKFDEVNNILSSEFPIDTPVTDTYMPSMSHSASLVNNSD